MIESELDISSLELCEKIKNASDILLDDTNWKFKSIVFLTLNPNLLEFKLEKMLSDCNYINYKLVHLNQIVDEDFYSDKLLIILVKYGISIQSLRYSFRDIQVINFVYGNLLDCTAISIDLITKNLRLGERNV